MSEDILCRVRVHSEDIHLEMNEEIHNRVLVLIEEMTYVMCGTLLVRLRMPLPNREINDAFEQELQRERESGTSALSQLVQTCVLLLNPQQKEMYDTVMKVIDDGNVRMFFLAAPGCSGNTFPNHWFYSSLLLLEQRLHCWKVSELDLDQSNEIWYFIVAPFDNLNRMIFDGDRQKIV